MAEHNNQDLKASDPAELDSRQLTTKEIKELGLPVSPNIENIPEPVKCEYCGRMLYHEAVYSFGFVVCIRSTPQRCICDKAVEYWKTVDEETKRRQNSEHAKKKHELYLKRCKRAGIDKRHINCSFDNYVVDKNNKQQVKAVEVLKNYLVHFDEYSEEGRSLYIEGTYGTGKTHLACAIAKSLIKNGKSVICKTPNDLLNCIRSTYDDNPYLSEHQILKHFKTVDLLIVDDFGKQKPTEWGMATMYDILNYRYCELLPTIITTNFNEEALKEALSSKEVDSTKIESIISRLHQSADVVTMAWSDYRGRADG